MKLKAEVAKWSEYKNNVLQWQCRTELARHANITEVEISNGEAIGAQLDMRLPCSEITTESTLGSICKVVSRHGKIP